MNRLLFVVVFVLLAARSYAAESSTVTRAEVDSLLQLSYNSYAMMDIQSSLEFANEALTLSEIIDYSKGRARGNFYISQVMWSLGENGKAMDHVHLAENEPCIKNDLILMSEVFRVKGRIYGSMKLYYLSIREFHRGLDIINKIDKDFERNYLSSLAYENLAVSHSLQNINDSAIFYLKKNKELLNNVDEAQFFRSKINLYGQLGKEYTIQEEYDSAVYYFEDAITLADANNFPYKSWIYLEWGNMYRQQGRIDLALDKYHTGLKNLEQTQLRNELPSIYGALRDMYLQIGQKEKALEYHEKKIEIENELAESNDKALDKIVKFLLDEEKMRQDSFINKSKIILSTVIFSILLFVFIIWLLFKKSINHFTEKDKELDDVIDEQRKHEIDEMIELGKNNDSCFLPRFIELFPNFTHNIYERHSNLTQSTFQFCTYIFLHFSSKEIADSLNIEHKSVQTRKNRLRKQLNLPHNTDLYFYMRSLDELTSEN